MKCFKWLLYILLNFVSYSSISEEILTEQLSYTHSENKDNHFYQLVSQLPKEAFQYANEGIFDEQSGLFNLAELLKTKKTFVWAIDRFRSDNIRITNNYSPDSRFTIIPLDLKSKKICVETLNAQLSVVECWGRLETAKQLVLLDIMPDIHVNEFLTKKDYFSDNYKEYASFYLDSNNEIKAFINTWMNHRLINKLIVWDVSLKWNGTHFEIFKRKIE